MLRRKVLQLCCSAILGEGLRGTESPVGERAIMLTPLLHCPSCQDAAIVCHDTTSDGPHCSRCRAGRPGRGRTFLLAYTYAGRSSEVKQQIVEMARHARYRAGVAREPDDSDESTQKKLGEPTEREQHFFRCFAVVHLPSWDQESAELPAFLYQKEREWQLVILRSSSVCYPRKKGPDL